MENIREDAAFVAANVAARIKHAGTNPHALAKASGIPVTNLTRNLLGNEPGFSTTQLFKIAPHLGTTPSSFYRPIESAVN